MFMRQLQISKYGKLIFLLVDGCNIAVRNSKILAVLLTKLPCVSINPVWVWVDTICPILTINARQAHQIDDTPRAHAATNQRGMWSHTLTLQCKHCKTAQLLNSLSKHIGSKNSWANFSNKTHYTIHINPLKLELNFICYLLALLAHHFLHVSRIRVKSLKFRRLMSYIYIYIYGAPILDVSRSHTTTQHSR